MSQPSIRTVFAAAAVVVVASTGCAAEYDLAAVPAVSVAFVRQDPSLSFEQGELKSLEPLGPEGHWLGLLPPVAEVPAGETCPRLSGRASADLDGVAASLDAGGGYNVSKALFDFRDNEDACVGGSAHVDIDADADAGAWHVSDGATDIDVVVGDIAVALVEEVDGPVARTDRLRLRVDAGPGVILQSTFAGVTHKDGSSLGIGSRDFTAGDDGYGNVIFRDGVLSFTFPEDTQSGEAAINVNASFAVTVQECEGVATCTASASVSRSFPLELQ